MTIPEYILHLLATEWSSFQNPYDINSGNCEDFAMDLIERFPEGDMFWGDELVEVEWENYYEPDGHCFFYYEGLYFDSECPNGVKSPKDLPFFKRQANYAELYT